METDASDGTGRVPTVSLVMAEAARRESAALVPMATGADISGAPGVLIRSSSSSSINKGGSSRSSRSSSSSSSSIVVLVKVVLF